VSLFTVFAVVDHKSHVGEKLGKRVEAAIRKLNCRPSLIVESGEPAYAHYRKVRAIKLRPAQENRPREEREIPAEWAA
jgi:hypothetical protein